MAIHSWVYQGVTLYKESPKLRKSSSSEGLTQAADFLTNICSIFTLKQNLGPGFVLRSTHFQNASFNQYLWWALMGASLGCLTIFLCLLVLLLIFFSIVWWFISLVPVVSLDGCICGVSRHFVVLLVLFACLICLCQPFVGFFFFIPVMSPDWCIRGVSHDNSWVIPDLVLSPVHHNNNNHYSKSDCERKPNWRQCCQRQYKDTGAIGKFNWIELGGERGR